MDNKDFSIVASPTRKHKCNTTGWKDHWYNWEKYTVIVCEGCGQKWYHNWFLLGGWGFRKVNSVNRAWVEHKTGTEL